MINYNKINDDINRQWLTYKGRANICIFPPISVIACIYPTFIKYLDKNTTKECLIIIEDFNYRNTIVQHFKQNLGIKRAEEYLNRIRIISTKFLKTISPKYEFVTLIGIESYNLIEIYNNSAKFILNIIINNKLNLQNYNAIVNLLPLISLNISANDILKSRLQSPVKEHRIQVELDDESFNRYKKQTDYITDSMKIFGDADTITACRIGNTKVGLTAIECRLRLARYNGWSETLDKSVEINKRIDTLFSPLAIEERANNVFNISRLRRDLIENYPAKINEILKIINNNKDKKILIVSKSGNFANDIAEYINSHCDDVKCVQYHNEIPKSYLPDTDGKPITYKTGENKGKEKLFGAVALSNYYLKLFNAGYSNVLSIKYASEPILECNCDIVIFTSTLLPNIFEFKTRYTNITFPDSYTETYRLYCRNTIEENVFYKEQQNSLITICETPQNDNIKINESTGEIIL